MRGGSFGAKGAAEQLPQGWTRDGWKHDVRVLRTEVPKHALQAVQRVSDCGRACVSPADCVCACLRVLPSLWTDPWRWMSLRAWCMVCVWCLVAYAPATVTRTSLPVADACVCVCVRSATRQYLMIGDSISLGMEVSELSLIHI